MKGVKIDVHSIHAPSAILGAILGGSTGSVLCYLLVRNRVRARADAEIASVKQHYRARAELAKDGSNDSGYLAYRAAVNRARALGYGDPSGAAHEETVRELSEDFDNGHDDRADYGPDSEWPGTAEDVRGEFDHISSDDSFGTVHQVEGSIEKVADGSATIRDYSGKRNLFGNQDGIERTVVWPPADRDESKPFRIDDDEFAEENGYSKITLTYYLADKILVDDKEDPIRDIIGTTGPLRAEDFGGVSLDPHIQYIRNNRLECDFETILHQGSYAEIVLNYGNPNNKKGDRKSVV